MPEDRQESAAPDSQSSSFLAEFGAEYDYAAIIGVLLVLNVTGVFKYIFGLDTAILITLLAGYKTFYNSISALLEKTISADLALCVAVIAALSVGEYLAAAEAMFIVLVGETSNLTPPAGPKPRSSASWSSCRVSHACCWPTAAKTRSTRRRSPRAT